MKLCYFRKRYFYKKSPKLFPILDVIFASILTTMLIMVIPQYIYPNCRSNSDISGCEDNGDHTCHDLTNQNQFTCNDGEYNAVSALLLGEREQIIKYVFHYDSRKFFEPTQLLICSVAYFILSVYTYGLSIPSGLFIPLILIGSTFGWWFGWWWEYLFVGTNNSQELNTYALMGASALLGGSTRMTISLTAIIMEITNDIYYLLPIMLVVMVSKGIGDLRNAAIYESHVALNQIPYLEHSLPKWIPSYLCAKDIMTKKVMCLPIVCPLRIINRCLRDPTKIHNAFPIIDCEPTKPTHENYTKEDGKFVGIMLRWHIMIILSKRNFDVMDRLPELELLTLDDLTDSAYKNKYIRSYQKDFGISKNELEHCYVDFSPYMHLSPFTVTTYTPIYRVYTLFRGLGLRHLVVLDTNNKYVDGIITCDNLKETELEEAVNNLNRKIERYKMRDKDYVGQRLQQMNQSKAIKKYKLSKRLRSIDTLNNYNEYSVAIPENDNEASPHSHEDPHTPNKLVKFSIAKDSNDMKHTINTENILAV